MLQIPSVLACLNVLRLLGSATRSDFASHRRSGGSAARSEAEGTSRNASTQGGADSPETQQPLPFDLSSFRSAVHFLPGLGGKPGCSRHQARMGTLCW